MGIIDPKLLATRAPALIEDNLRLRALLRRVADRMPGMGNSDLMAEIRDQLANAP